MAVRRDRTASHPSATTGASTAEPQIAASLPSMNSSANSGPAKMQAPSTAAQVGSPLTARTTANTPRAPISSTAIRNALCVSVAPSPTSWLTFDSSAETSSCWSAWAYPAQ